MTVIVTETPEEVVVNVKGELDLSSASVFRQSVEQALAIRAGRRLVVELTESAFIDSAGLEQLLMANRALMANGDRLLVRGRPKSQPRTVLSVAGFGAVMDVEP